MKLGTELDAAMQLLVTKEEELKKIRGGRSNFVDQSHIENINNLNELIRIKNLLKTHGHDYTQFQSFKGFASNATLTSMVKKELAAKKMLNQDSSDQVDQADEDGVQSDYGEEEDLEITEATLTSKRPTYIFKEY